MRMANTNVLTGLKCPKCGSLEPFSIATTCWARVYDDGIDQTEDHEWDGNSACVCLNPGCRFSGRIKDFEPKRKTSGNRDRRTPDAKRRSKAWAKKVNE